MSDRNQTQANAAPAQTVTRVEALSRLMADALTEDIALDRRDQYSAVDKYEQAILAEAARSISDCRIQVRLAQFASDRWVDLTKR